jgi:hypothetical protein
MDIPLVNRAARHSAHLEPWKEWLVATNKNANEKKDYWTTKSLVYSSAVVWSCYMSPKRHIRATRIATIWLGTSAVAALLALLVAQNVFRQFPQASSSHHSSIRAIRADGPRTRFDCDGSQWSGPVDIALPFPPATEAAPLTFTPWLLSALQVEGFHYQRPPPSC